VFPKSGKDRLGERNLSSLIKRSMGILEEEMEMRRVREGMDVMECK
jgi:hypothetical protein